MNRLLVALLFPLPLLLSACGSSSNGDSIMDEASRIQDELRLVLSDTDNALAASASAIRGVSLEDPAVRKTVGNLCTERAYSIDCSVVDSHGVMRIIEPQEYSKYEGSDISGQAAVREVIATKRPVVGSMFETVEHLNASVIQYPVLTDSGDLTEFISLLFQPRLLFGDPIAEELSGTEDSAWVMQTDGLIVYETDPEQIGLNLFTDPGYQDYPELLALGRRVVNESSGEGSYSFTVAGGSEVVTKQAAWQTVEQYGYQWKVVVYRVAR